MFILDMASSKINIDSAIPSGSWTLYFHSPEETKWDLSSFIKIGTSKSWHDWLSLMTSIGNQSIGDGMFFLMRDPIPPLWENSKNIRGGSYSFRTLRQEAGNTFNTISITCMIDAAMINSENRVHGISISPKKGFNIIKIWNVDSSKYKSPTDMKICIEGLKHEEILYTPFLDKKM